MTLYLLKVHLQTFLSISTIQKRQILSCDTLVANERYTLPCENSQGSVRTSCTFTVNLSIYVYSWTTVQKDQSKHLVCKHTVVSVLFSPFTPAQRTQHRRTETHSTLPCNNQRTSGEQDTMTLCQLSNKLPLSKLWLWTISFSISLWLDSNGKALQYSKHCCHAEQHVQ